MTIAAGNGKATDRDRRRYFEIARGSVLECGAIQAVLEVCGARIDARCTNLELGTGNAGLRLVACWAGTGGRGKGWGWG